MEFATVALAFVLAAAPATPQPAPRPDAAVVEAVQLAQRAAAGDAKAIEPALQAFQALAQADPAQPLYGVYVAMVTGLKARDAWMPWTKLKYAEEALDGADRALQALTPAHDRQLVRGAPVGIETRIVAARLFLRTPDEFFHRAASGRKLIAEVLARPDFAGAPSPLQAAGHLAAAEAARGRSNNEELTHLKQVVALAPASSSAQLARARLKELGQ
jgi:hypothetical protein